MSREKKGTWSKMGVVSEITEERGFVLCCIEISVAE